MAKKRAAEKGEPKVVAKCDTLYEETYSQSDLIRQVGSSLYERLALRRDKDEVMRLAREGQTIEKFSNKRALLMNRFFRS